MKRYERNGEVWEVSATNYVRYAGEPCIQLDMRGNPETFFESGTEIIEVADLGNDWTRYWYMPGNPELRANYTCLVELYEHGRSRGRNE